MGVGVAFAADTLTDWVIRLALVTGGTLPATLSWLLVACVSKRLLARLAPAVQYAAAVGLGAMAGMYGCLMLAVSGLLGAPPWVASAVTGALQ